jgi:UDP-GlcNAc:undecaprenyl-phosphate GlcNAc-1-phosphate transferase
MYVMSICLCLISLFLVNVREERASFLLILVGIGGIVFAKKLGYFDYVNPARMVSWIKGISDETGISRERRSFLNIQIHISSSKTLEELWENIIRAMEMLQFDCCMMYLNFLQSPEEMKKRAYSKPEAMITAGRHL